MLKFFNICRKVVKTTKKSFQQTINNAKKADFAAGASGQK